MQTTTKKTQNFNTENDHFSSLLDDADAKPTIFFSDSLKETVDNFMQAPSAAETFKCKLCLAQLDVVCNLIAIDTRLQSTVIKAEIDRNDAWTILNSLDSLSRLEIEQNKNMLDNYTVTRVKLSKQKSNDKFLLRIKLLKS